MGGTRYLYCVLICEGSTDREFLPELLRRAIRELALDFSGPAMEVEIIPLPVRHSEVDKILAALSEADRFDLLLYHHDGRPERTAEEKIAEVRQAVSVRSEPLVPVVPVREIEAWILADPAALARASALSAAAAAGLVPKRARDVEEIVDPKKVLAAATAGTSGGFARANQAERFARIAEHVDLARLRQVPSFQRWLTDMTEALARLGYKK